MGCQSATVSGDKAELGSLPNNRLGWGGGYLKKPQGKPVSVPSPIRPGNQMMSGFSALPRALQKPSPRTPQTEVITSGVVQTSVQPQSQEFREARGGGGGGCGEPCPLSPSRTALDLNTQLPAPRLPGRWASPSKTEKGAAWRPPSPPHQQRFLDI